ncbi:MAG: outer membrane protein transport protein [Pseudomonadota bacterium]|nr:OmpP1/FadL family transporter [Gammaproteobacteria bacterium]MBU1558999.1 OmpP1/FadL family transporter [Gammaproteobacteria bacterium]MBU1926362.1 OmpP1/FadL family transporter [Gammaproteobacteria bacterium]MBU2545889.1 OmpP1/FadL family transporter [Gammaproteobacteria bacterium]
MTHKQQLTIAVFSLTLFASPLAFASAYQSFEQNASGLGESYAGSASKAEDATVEYDNPAGMVRMKRVAISLSTVAVNAHSDFRATGATNVAGADILSTGNPKAHPLGTDYLPAFHAVIPVNQRIFLGLGVSVPFGLETNYPDNSAARYFGTHSQITTVNINPSIAFALTNRWSFGVGVDALYLKSELDEQVDAGVLLHGATDVSSDVGIKNSASDWGYGWNAGILYQLSPDTRFGLSYRSQIFVKPTGKSKVDMGALNSTDQTNLRNLYHIQDGDVSTRITLPETVVFSAFQQMTPKWSVMGSVTYTRWERFDYLTMQFTSGLSDATVHENFHNTFKYAVGTEYCLNSNWLLRAGLAYDESPVKNAYRTIALPDANREWVSFGIRYRMNHMFSVDAGYAYVHINRGSVHQTSGSESITGDYRSNYANLIGLQINGAFG